MKTPKALKKGLPSAGYEVGYGKPPKSGQFKPGQSGNPKGRPRGQPSISEILMEEIGKLVKIKTGDKVIELPKKRALMRKLLDSALHGEIRAQRLLISMLAKAEADLEAQPESEPPLTEDELAVLRLIGQERD